MTITTSPAAESVPCPSPSSDSHGAPEMAVTTGVCPCESNIAEPGPHIASCPWSDPNYEPTVCPGCYAINEEPCAAYCIDAEIAQEREAELSGESACRVCECLPCDCDDYLDDVTPTGPMTPFAPETP